MKKLRFSIVGHGRLGKLVEEVLNERKEKISEIIDPKEGLDWEEGSLSNADAAICFVDPAAGYETSKRILRSGTNAVVGTTKFYENPDGSLNNDILMELESLAKANDTRFLYAPNFSPGMNLCLAELQGYASTHAKLGYKPIILEVHHTGKTKDVSGTAKRFIGDVLLKAYPDKDGLWFSIDSAIWPEKNSEVYDNFLLNVPFDQSVKGKSADQIREQIQYAESRNKIPLIAIRYGDIPGTHRVTFIGESDVKNIDHVVTDRKIFAKGAVDTAHWLLDQKPGLYCITDRL